MAEIVGNLLPRYIKSGQVFRLTDSITSGLPGILPVTTVFTEQEVKSEYGCGDSSGLAPDSLGPN